MKSTRWKSASLAINTIIRGLDLDQVAFRYDLEAERFIVAMSAWSRPADGSDAAVAFSDKRASA